MIEIQQKSGDLILTTSHKLCMKITTSNKKWIVKNLCRKKIPSTFSQGCTVDELCHAYKYYRSINTIAWIKNFIDNLIWDVITSAGEAGKGHYIPLEYVDVFTYPCPHLDAGLTNLSVKDAPENMRWHKIFSVWFSGTVFRFAKSYFLYPTAMAVLNQWYLRKHKNSHFLHCRYQRPAGSDAVYHGAPFINIVQL